jgi:hypothetical protein
MNQLLIKKILREYIGRQEGIYQIEDLVTEDIIKGITQYINDFNSNTYRTLINEFDVENPQLQESTGIGSIRTEIGIKLGETFSSSGNIDPDKITSVGNGLFKVFITMNLIIDVNNLKNLNTEISKIISHELHHAFSDIKQINKKSKSKVYNISRNRMKLLKDILLKHPQLKEFMDMFYLNLPQEMSARVQETSSELRNIIEKDYNNAIRELLKYQPINDAKRMMNYKQDITNTVDTSDLKTFVDQFNKEIQSNSKKYDVKIKERGGVEEFFNYWTKRINENGYKLLRKILKLVADKHNKTDQETTSHLNESMFNKLFKEYINY